MLSKEDKEDIRLGRAFEAMVATEGWIMFSAHIQNLMEQKKKEVLRPFVVTQEEKARGQVMFAAMDAFLTSEAQKGALLALSHALEFPSLTIRNAKEILSRDKTGSEENE